MFSTSPVVRRGKVQKECIEISKMRVYISHQSLFIIEVNTTLEKRDFPVIAAAAFAPMLLSSLSVSPHLLSDTYQRWLRNRDKGITHKNLISEKDPLYTLTFYIYPYTQWGQ